MDLRRGTYTYTDSRGQKRRVPIEQVNSFSQLRKGDHLAIPRQGGLYWHHAIVKNVLRKKGNIIVIEYSGNEFLQDISDLRRRGKAEVMTGNYTLEDELYVVKHPDDTSLSEAGVVARAQRRLGERRYDLFEQNCEHFVMWCKTGMSSSEQIKIMEEKAINTAGTIFGITAVVQLVASRLYE